MDGLLVELVAGLKMGLGGLMDQPRNGLFYPHIGISVCRRLCTDGLVQNSELELSINMLLVYFIGLALSFGAGCCS